MWVDGPLAQVAAGDFKIEQRWEPMGLVRRAPHLSKVYRDLTIAQHEVGGRRARRGFERMSLLRAALIGQLSMTERLAGWALEEIRPQAERLLAERRPEAEQARQLLAARDHDWRYRQQRAYGRGRSR